MKDRKKFDYRIIKIVFTCLSFFLCVFDKAVNGYEILFLIPLVYLICCIFTKIKKEEIKNNIACLTIDGLTFLKYSIMPLLIAISDDYYAGVLTSHIPSRNYLMIGIILCCVECVAIFIITHLFFRYRKRNDVKKINKEIKNNFPMKVFTIISIACIGMFSEGFFPKQFLVIDESYQNVVINSSVDGLIKIIFFLFKLFVLLYTTQYFLKKYNSQKKYTYVLGIFAVIILYLMMSTSTSRWGLVLPIFVFLFILRDVWFSTRRNKIIICIMGVILSISFISISLFKFQWLFVNSSGNITISKVVGVLGSQLQEYISGPRAIAQGIETIDVYRDNITYKTLINDFTGSIPYISKFVDQNNRINIYYNYLLKGTKRGATQIMPMITIGYAYFTYALSYIFIVICILLCYYYGEKEKSSEDIFHKYIYAMISIRFALCLGFNTQIIFAWYITYFFPFIIIMKANKLIKE